jgi:glycosyltransferase involved in cell wall biosynthesis
VGQCADVLEEGRCGLIVPPGSPGNLAGALLALLKSPVQRKEFGDRFSERVRRIYGAEKSVEGICEVYGRLLAGKREGGAS